MPKKSLVRLKRRFIKLFAGSKYDILVIVLEQADGSVVWNIMPRSRGDMNKQRTGKLVYRDGKKRGE
jgi:hypothetical protein